MSLLINLILIPFKLLVLPIYIFLAFLTLMTGLAKGISKMVLGFFSFIALAIAIVGFFSGLPVWAPMLVICLVLALIPALFGLVPFFFRSLASVIGRFLHFWA